MKLHDPCLVLVADGHRARLFEERVRGGPLTEVSDRLGDLTHSGPRASSHAGRVHDRHGAGSHTLEGMTPKDKDEARFLETVARGLDGLMRETGHELVVIAPPRALGRLRADLGETTRRRLKATESRERTSQTAEDIRHALHDLRLKQA